MKVAIVDYGAGNLRSVMSALRHLGCDAVVIKSAHDVQSSHAMILPGVGAAADTMKNLQRTGLSDVVAAWIAAERPVLGICMGMQILFTHSDEGTGQPCLGILPGRVVRLPNICKVPHIGWNQVYQTRKSALFHGIPDDSYFYFVHSFVAEPHDASIIAATTHYGTRFCSTIQHGLTTATQFHPEKSGANGLRLYENFLKLAAA